jgi:hypothetical protein
MTIGFVVLILLMLMVPAVIAVTPLVLMGMLGMGKCCGRFLGGLLRLVALAGACVVLFSLLSFITVRVSHHQPMIQGVERHVGGLNIYPHEHKVFVEPQFGTRSLVERYHDPIEQHPLMVVDTLPAETLPAETVPSEAREIPLEPLAEGPAVADADQPPAADGSPAAEEAAPSGARTVRAADRPSWIDQPPRMVGRVHQRVISAGPYRTLEECYGELGTAASKAIGEFLVGHRDPLFGDLSDTPPTLADLGIDMDYVESQLSTARYEETLQASFGEMQQVHLLLEFNATAQQDLHARWREHLRGARYVQTTLWAGIVFGGVAIAYLLLQIDSWTRGYYTKRLFLGVPAAIIGALAMLLA